MTVSASAGLCRWLLCCVLVPLSAVAAAAADLVESSAAVTSVAKVHSLAGRLRAIARSDIDTLEVARFVVLADSYGNLVSRTRDLDGGLDDFQQLIALGRDLRERAREKVRHLERGAGEDEARLETLYRSDLWHDINYALSAFGYWQAWGLLGIAHTTSDTRERVAWLNKAEQGFQSSSVRILYPGIVYGSWLGMGYVSRARGNDDAAEQRFRRLVQALVSDPDNPVRKIAEAELTVLAIRRGEQVPISQVKDEPLSPSLANVYLEEAFVLLEQHRKTQSGAIEASKRLKRLIDAGYLNNALVSRILAYRDEIVGQDLGLFSLYVDTEFAFAYDQYDTVVLKYRQFMERGGASMLINLQRLQYHYTVALMKVGQLHDALAEATKLREKTDLVPTVAAALPKLSFLIARALYEQKDSNRNRARVLNAAEYFLAKNPEDPDISAAHLVLGQLSFRPDRAKYHLREAKKDTRLKGSVGLSELKRAITAFNQASANVDDGRQKRHARDVLAKLEALPRRMHDTPWLQAVQLQMQTVLGERVVEVLERVDKLLAPVAAGQPALTADVRQVLLWTRLRAQDQVDRQGLIAWLGGRDSKDRLEQKEIYSFLLEKERRAEHGDLVELIQVFYPALAGQTQDQRQLRLMQLRSLTALGRHVEVLELARAMVRDFPASGDAWVAYAEAAERAGDVFAAERAWSKITSAQPDGSPRWRSGMARRLDLLARLDGRHDDLCRVIADARRYRHLATDSERAALEAAADTHACAAL